MSYLQYSLKDIELTFALYNCCKEKGLNITVGAYPYGAAMTVVGAAMFTTPGWRDRMSSTAENFQFNTKRMPKAELAIIKNKNQ